MRRAASQAGAARILGYGVGLWLAGISVITLGTLLPGRLALIQVLWLPFMTAAAVMGILGAVRSVKAGTWPTVVLFPAGIFLVILSGLGAIAPLAM